MQKSLSETSKEGKKEQVEGANERQIREKSPFLLAAVLIFTLTKRPLFVALGPLRREVEVFSPN